MEFSVLISVYFNDKPEHFEQALESISVKQTLKPSQIVIIQDGPVQEKIEKVIDKFIKKERNIEFTVLKKNENKGLAAALNDGLLLCKYNYVARMDADDIAVNNRFELQVKELETNHDIDILGGYIAEFENDPNRISSIRTVGLTHDEVLKMAKHRCPFNHMTVMYKKNKVKEAGGYATDIGRLEDYKLWTDMISQGCVCANIPKILVKTRTGNGLIQRRSDYKEIRDWDKLQLYLRKAKIINWIDSLVNKIYIRVFTYAPPLIKKRFYKYFLRTKRFKEKNE